MWQQFVQHDVAEWYDAKAMSPQFIATQGRRPHAQITAWAMLAAMQDTACFLSGNAKIMLRQRRPERCNAETPPQIFIFFSILMMVVSGKISNRDKTFHVPATIQQHYSGATAFLKIYYDNYDMCQLPYLYIGQDSEQNFLKSTCI